MPLGGSLYTGKENIAFYNAVNSHYTFITWGCLSGNENGAGNSSRVVNAMLYQLSYTGEPPHTHLSGRGLSVGGVGYAKLHIF